MAHKPLVSAKLSDSGAGRGIRARVSVHGLGDGLAAVGDASRDEVKRRGTKISCAMTNDSRQKRSTWSASRAQVAPKTLMATIRSTLICRALNTVPMAPS